MNGWFFHRIKEQKEMEKRKVYIYKINIVNFVYLINIKKFDIEQKNRDFLSKIPFFLIYINFKCWQQYLS